MAEALYPAIEPYRTEHLDVGDGHRLYLEQSGNPEGLPVLVLHGGPGGASTPRLRRFFDPARYRIVCFDQRGCGKSLPVGERHANDTRAQLADIERLRGHLGVARWLLFGGSWGATLALLYAGSCRDRCLGLLLRGSFLAERADLDWFFHGAAGMVPDAWAAFEARVPRGDGESVMAACLRVLGDDDAPEAAAVAAAWFAWESTLARPWQRPPVAAASSSSGALASYRLQAAYLTRQCDLHDGEVLEAAAAAGDLPAALVHGRLDLVCRPMASWSLWRTMPQARLRLVDQAGHDSFPSGMAKALTEAADRFAADGHFAGLGSEWFRR
ncbi:MAG: prolyl aminopeptidase [Burkholderiaceae bacterium]